MSESTSQPLSVSVRNATAGFGGNVLFDDLALDLPGGAWSCLLGPSGVGKTTLLRVIAGLAADGHALATCSDGGRLAGRVAYMAQQDLLCPWLTVLDNVTLGARLRGERPNRERARALLNEVGLGGNAGDLPAQLSGGMRQRAALVRTLMEDRPVVLMDEPFSALDAITRVRLQGLAAQLLVGRTVLLVTHDPLEAVRLGHQIHVLAGRPAELEPVAAPAGAPPRAFDSHDVLEAQARLLASLTAADAAGEAA